MAVARKKQKLSYTFEFKVVDNKRKKADICAQFNIRSLL